MGDVNQSSPRQLLARTVADMASRNDPVRFFGKRLQLLQHLLLGRHHLQQTQLYAVPVDMAAPSDTNA